MVLFIDFPFKEGAQAKLFLGSQEHSCDGHAMPASSTATLSLLTGNPSSSVAAHCWDSPGTASALDQDLPALPNNAMPDLERMTIVSGIHKHNGIHKQQHLAGPQLTAPSTVHQSFVQSQTSCRPSSGLELLTGVSEWYRLHWHNGAKGSDCRPVAGCASFTGRDDGHSQRSLPGLESFCRPWTRDNQGGKSSPPLQQNGRADHKLLPTAAPQGMSNYPASCQTVTHYSPSKEEITTASLGEHSTANDIATQLLPMTTNHETHTSSADGGSCRWKGQTEPTEGTTALKQGNIPYRASLSEDPLDIDIGRKRKRDGVRDVEEHDSHDGWSVADVQNCRALSLVVKINIKGLRISQTSQCQTMPSLGALKGAPNGNIFTSCQHGGASNCAPNDVAPNNRAFTKGAHDNISSTNGTLKATQSFARSEVRPDNNITVEEVDQVNVRKDEENTVDTETFHNSLGERIQADKSPSGSHEFVHVAECTSIPRDTEGVQSNINSVLDHQRHSVTTPRGIACQNSGRNSDLANMPTEHLPLRKRHKRNFVPLSVAANETLVCRGNTAATKPAAHLNLSPIHNGCDANEPATLQNNFAIDELCKNDQSQKSTLVKIETSRAHYIGERATQGGKPYDGRYDFPSNKKYAMTMTSEKTVPSERAPSADSSEGTSELSPFTATPNTDSLCATPDLAASPKFQPQIVQPEQSDHNTIKIDRKTSGEETPQSSPDGDILNPRHSAKQPRRTTNSATPHTCNCAPPTTPYHHHHQLPYSLMPFPNSRLTCDPRLSMMPLPTHTTNSPLTPYLCHGDVSSQHGAARPHLSPERICPPLTYQVPHPVGHHYMTYPVNGVRLPPCHPFIPYANPTMPLPPPLQSTDGLLYPSTSTSCPVLPQTTHISAVPNPPPSTHPVISATVTPQTTPTTTETARTTRSAMMQSPTPQEENGTPNSSAHAPVSSHLGQSETNFAPLKRAPGRSRNSNHLSNGVALGETTFLCEVCNKIFPLQRLLNRHMKCHSATKRYNCLFCSKGFNDTFDLKRHVRTHTGVRPYKCEYCSKAFTQRCSLESHLSKVHRFLHDYNFKQRRSKVFVCEECGATTEQGEEHYAHIRDAHPNSAELLKFQEKFQFQKLLRRCEAHGSSPPVGAPSGPTTPSAVWRCAESFCNSPTRDLSE